MIDLLHIAGFSAIFQSTLAVIYNLHESRNDKRVEYVLFSFLLLIISFLTFCAISRYSLSWMDFVLISYSFSQFGMLLGFCLYLFVLSFPGKRFNFKKWYFVPISLSVFAALYYLLIFIFPDMFPRVFANLYLEIIGSGVNIIFFVLTALSVVRMHKSGDSNVSRKSILWITFVVIGVFLVWFLRLAFFIVWDIAINYRVGVITLNTFFSISFIVFNVGFIIALRRPQWDDKKKYTSSLLDGEDKDLYSAMILDCIDSKKPYLDSEITIKKFSDMVQIPPHYVSQVLNEVFEKNFFDFINSYRIEESKKLMMEEEKKTVIEILFSVGFNSKSTFNMAFRRHTGMTPKEFRRNLHRN